MVRKRIYTPETIKSLQRNEIFVFGSNLKGVHGAGAAKKAYQSFGAIWGRPSGIQGKSYAIPTKDQHLKPLPLGIITKFIKDFIVFAQNNPKFTFFVTKIGCGLAGYCTADIATIFNNIPNIPSNVVLPIEFSPKYETLPVQSKIPNFENTTSY